MMIIIIITYEQQKYLFIVIFFPWKITLIKIVIFSARSRILIGILGRKRKRLYNKSIDGESGCFCYRVTL